MTDLQMDSSSRVPHGTAESDQFPTEGKQKRIEQENGGQKARPDPSSRQGALVSQVLQPQYMKLANPGPLGLLSFALTTFALGLYECGAGYV